VCLEPRRGDLLDDIAPTGATLDGDRDDPVGCPRRELVEQPTSEPLTIRLPDPASPHLAAVHLQRVEGDLTSMQIEPTYDAHREPPCSHRDD